MVIRAAISILAGISYLVFAGFVPVDANSLSLHKQIEQLIEKGNYQKADLLVKDALKKTPSNPSLLYLKGRVEYGEGDTEQALKLMKKAINLDPKNAEAHWYLGLIYMSQNQTYDGVDEWRQAVKLRPKLVKSKNCHCKSLEALFKQYPERKKK